MGAFLAGVKKSYCLGTRVVASGNGREAFLMKTSLCSDKSVS